MIHKRATLLAKVSSTLDDWHNSVYGKILRMTDPSTLVKVRQFWIKYSGFAEKSPATLENIRDTFMKRFFQIHKEKFTGGSWHAIGSAGATGTVPHAMESTIKEFERFWKSGVIGSLPEFTEGATYINPLFVHSNVGGDKCVIHYATDPILGFHCATAFADILPSTPAVSFGAHSQNATLEENVHRLARTAVWEFKQWCATFHSVAGAALLDPRLLTIYNHGGEALQFCWTLQSALQGTDNIFQACAAPWNTHLDFPANSNFIGPFDAIDSSNVADHAGLLNVLSCALPLLIPAPHSVLYTESVSTMVTTKLSPFDCLRSLLCGEPSAVFTLLRAAPMECLTGVSTTYSFQDQIQFQSDLYQSLGLRNQLHWRLSWKDMMFIDQHLTSFHNAPPIPLWDTDSLARTLVSIYTGMFKDEDFTLNKLKLENKPRLEIHLMPQHYTRASFVAFLKMIQGRCHSTNWSHVYNKVIELISVDIPLNLQSQGAQEVFLQLHLQRLHTCYVLQESLKSSDICIPESWPDVFRKSPLPLTIPLLFRIPRAACRDIIKEFNAIQAVTDIVLEVVVSCPPISNTYSVLQVTFANQVAGLPSKWNESQDLVVYVFVPAWTILMRSRKATTISLQISANYATLQQFSSLLGRELKVFQTSIWNSEYVIPTYTQQFPPVLPDSLSKLEAGHSPVSGPGFQTTLPKIQLTDEGILEATIRIALTGNNKSKLSSGDKVDSFQKSPCTFCVVLGNSTIEIALPFPSEYPTALLRVARKSGWIEVITRFTKGTSGLSFNFTTFPVIKDATGGYYSWNMPRLAIKLLPQLRLSTHNKLWSGVNLSGTFAAGELKIREKHIKDPVSGDPMVDLKENIGMIFRDHEGSENSKMQPPHKVFFLNVEKAGIMSIIFLVGMRLTTNGDTLVADSYVLPLNPLLGSAFRKELAVLKGIGGIMLPYTEKSYELWTTYIRASVERSRSWKHESGCPGKLQDGMVDHLQQFLCRCGAGKVKKEFEAIDEWKPFTPFVTHCLFTPIFPVSCMEPVMPAEPRRTGNPSALGDHGGAEAARSCLTCKIKETTDGKLFNCTGCGTAVYCSKQCQRKDWKQHKLICRSD